MTSSSLLRATTTFIATTYSLSMLAIANGFGARPSSTAAAASLVRHTRAHNFVAKQRGVATRTTIVPLPSRPHSPLHHLHITSAALLLRPPNINADQRPSLRSRATTITTTTTRNTASVISAAMSSLSSESAAASATTAEQSSRDADTGPSYTLNTLPFDNAAIRELPVDVELRNYVRIVPDACFSGVAPDPVAKPVLVAKSDSALALLGLPPEEGEREDAASYFSGEAKKFVSVDKILKRVRTVLQTEPLLY